MSEKVIVELSDLQVNSLLDLLDDALMDEEKRIRELESSDPHDSDGDLGECRMYADIWESIANVLIEAYGGS